MEASNFVDTSDLEQRILGGFFKCNEAILSCGLDKEDFYYPIHRAVFAKLQEIYNDKGTVCLVDFKAWDLSTGFNLILPDDMKPFEYIRDIANSSLLLFRQDILNNCEILKDLRRKEKLVTLLEDFRLSAHDISYSDILAKISALAEKEGHGVVSSRDVLEAIRKQFMSPPSCYSSGIDALDKALAGGFYDGFTYGFCGAEKSGKTTLAHTVSYNMAKLGTPHLYIALEMGSTQIEQRNIARDMGFNSLSFLNRRKEIAFDMGGARPRDNLWYYDAPGATKQEIINVVAQSKLVHGIKGFILDYWQLVQGKDSRDTEERHLRDVAQGLADFARKNNLFCILLAQMNQDGKLFGGNGLRKACDQLYMLNTMPEDDGLRWLKMDATRYTMICDVGGENNPALRLNKRVGPYFEGF